MPDTDEPGEPEWDSEDSNNYVRHCEEAHAGGDCDCEEKPDD